MEQVLVFVMSASLYKLRLKDNLEDKNNKGCDDGCNFTSNCSSHFGTWNFVDYLQGTFTLAFSSNVFA